MLEKLKSLWNTTVTEKFEVKDIDFEAVSAQIILEDGAVINKQFKGYLNRRGWNYHTGLEVFNDFLKQEYFILEGKETKSVYFKNRVKKINYTIISDIRKLRYFPDAAVVSCSFEYLTEEDRKKYEQQ